MKITIDTKDIKKRGLSYALLHAYIKENPNARTKEIMCDIGLSESWMYWAIRELTADGCIEIIRHSDKKKSHIEGFKVLK